MLPWKSLPTLGLAAYARVVAKRFIKPIPNDELLREIDIFCELFSRPATVKKATGESLVLSYNR